MAWGNVAVAVLGCVAAVAVSVGFRVHAVTTGPVALLARAGGRVTAEVELTGDPRLLPSRGLVRRDRVVVEGRAKIVESAGRRFTVDVPVVLLGSGSGWRGLLPSQRILVHGPARPGKPGQLTAATILVRGSPRVLSGPSPVQRMAGRLRAGLREAAGVLPPEQAGLLPALVTGDVSGLGAEVRDDLRTAGLSHLTAVSGANLSVIAAGALALARLVGLRLPVRAGLVIVAMVAFAVVARPSPSVLRALVMGVVGAIALGSGRARDGVAALSVTALGLILFDPVLARSYGFALSVAATAGILVLAPPWRDRLRRRLPHPLSGWPAEALAVAAAAQAAVTPLLVLMSGELEPVAVPANLLAEPAVAPATVLGFAAALVAPVSMWAAQWLVRPAGLAVGWIITVAAKAAALPMAHLPWPGGPAGLLLLAGATALGALVLRRRRLRWAALAAVAGLVAAYLAVRPVIAPWPPRGWLLVACDVGQGDALVLAAGAHSAVMIDTGPDPPLADRCLRDLGVHRLPLIVLTHPHLDHVGGLDGALRGRAVGAVVVSPGRVPRSESARVSGDLRRRGIPEWTAGPGVRWRFGAAELTVLGPDPRPEAGEVPEGTGEGTVANNSSLVILVRWPWGSALLTGDVETEAQAALLRHGLPQADILKVPHHGSSRAAPGFFAATHARAALISVGAGNDYGHPAPATVSRLTWLGMRVYRTDTQGDLAVVATAGHLSIVPRGRVRQPHGRAQ